VYAPEEPSPVPGGTSLMETRSSGRPFQWRASAARRIGCSTSAGSSTSSRNRCSSRKRGPEAGETRTRTYRSMAADSTKPPWLR
jgi:hypothetical protein